MIQKQDRPETKRREIQSLQRAFDLIERVAGRPDGIALTQLSDESGLNRNTAFQLLSTLCALGYLDQHANKRYYLGNRMAQMANMEGFYKELIQVAQPILNELTRATGETAHIAKVNGAFVYFLAKCDSGQPLCVVTDLKVPLPVQYSSVGKVNVAMFQDDEIERLMQDITFEQMRPHSINSREGFWKEIAAIRACGYAIDDEEYFDGVRCVAAAVTDRSSRPVCALGISAPTKRMQQFEPFGQIVMDSAAKLRAQLGYI